MQQPSTKPFSIFALFFLLLLSATASAGGHKKPSTSTRIRVYYQETVSGPDQTSFIVASLPQSSNSTTSHIQFGQVRVFDNPLTEGPSPGSRLVGRAQGLGAVVSTDAAFLLSMNHVFTAGRFNGSSLATFGTILPAVDAEQTVVGGSGRFRMARGYLRRKLVAATAAAITVRFDLYVEHDD